MLDDILRSDEMPRARLGAARAQMSVQLLLVYLYNLSV